MTLLWAENANGLYVQVMKIKDHCEKNGSKIQLVTISEATSLRIENKYIGGSFLVFKINYQQERKQWLRNLLLASTL